MPYMDILKILSVICENLRKVNNYLINITYLKLCKVNNSI